MASKRTRPPVADGGDQPSNSSGAPPAPRELVVITAAGTDMRAARAGLGAAADAGTDTLASLIQNEGITLVPLFGIPENRLSPAMAGADFLPGAESVPEMSRFYHVDAPEERLDELAERLINDPSIEAAYVKPGAEPAQLNDMIATAMDAPPATPDFTPRQGYLNAAPGGIDARYAWTRPGGLGTGVRVIDIEGAWRFSHEDLIVNQGGVIGGAQSTDLLWRNHGTAVAGEIGGDRNSFGVTGIAPDANIRAVSIFGGLGSAAAIRLAADSLSAGDIILIELQRTGPLGAYIAIEWWPDDLAAIRYAVAKGVIVVEAAGNGAQNLDNPAYDNPQSGFPTSWRNPYRRNPVDSGAIVVGAGAPPSGNFGPDRSRLDFSNYGSMIDAQGWGREVVTAGYGDLQGGSNEDLWYTAQFSGTSSASPIVVGAIACVQGVRRAAGQPLRTPPQMRSDLRNTGTPQQAGPSAPLSQRIGNRPNLRQLIPPVKAKETKEFKDRKDIKEKEIGKESKDVRDSKHLKDARDTKNRFKEHKDVRENPKLIRENFPDPVDERIRTLEQTVDQLSHFIGGELRPDLTTSPLAGESDFQQDDAAALSEELRKQAVDAKTMKDDKDLEKTRDR